MIDFIATILLLFESKLYFCSVWWNGRAWVVLWRGTSCCPSLGIVPSLVTRAEVSQRIRDLWAFLRHLLRVLKSAGACPAPHHWISGIWGFFPNSQWRDPFGVSLVSLCTLLLFVRRSRANPFFTISLSLLRWNRFRASICGTSPSCNCCRIIFLLPFIAQNNPWPAPAF